MCLTECHERLTTFFSKSVILGAQDTAVNKTLQEINLGALKVVVNAVRRQSGTGSQTFSQPDVAMILQESDVMLLGEQDALVEAEKRLCAG
jgi:hypothetical protein